MASARRTIGFLGVLVAVVALVAWLVRPVPVPVDLASIALGTVAVTIDEDGEARAHDRFVVAAPVAGRLLRIELHEGDLVRAGQTLARLAPAPLSAAEREQTLARLAAAESLVAEAEHRAAKVRAELEQARRELARVEELLVQGLTSEQAREQARLAAAELEREAAASEARQRATVSEVAAVRALLAPEQAAAPLISLTSPSDGSVLRILEKSERVVATGAPVLVVGDAARLEAVADLLSSDAARVKPGMRVTLSKWGGPDLEGARVRTVEPSAFTKVSALGVEEQRVNVVIDLPSLPDRGAVLGDGYRVEARFFVAEKAQVLAVPTAALFRQALAADQWAVFAIVDGRARLRPVEIGLRGARSAEVLGGLTQGDQVILYPSNQVSDGVRVVDRKPAAGWRR